MMNLDKLTAYQKVRLAVNPEDTDNKRAALLKRMEGLRLSGEQIQCFFIRNN